MNKKGLFTRRVHTTRFNYYLFTIIALVAFLYAGNLSQEYISLPTFGLSTITFIGILTGIGAIIALMATRSV